MNDITIGEVKWIVRENYEGKERALSIRVSLSNGLVKLSDDISITASDIEWLLGTVQDEQP